MKGFLKMPNPFRTRHFVLLLLITFVPLLSSCVVEKMEPTDANIDLFVALEYKRSECGSVPPIPLFVIDELEKNALAGCVIAIISTPCPMTEYPLICVRMYGQNVPGAVDLQDAFVP
jgi:hypothetical protein